MVVAQQSIVNNNLVDCQVGLTPGDSFSTAEDIARRVTQLDEHHTACEFIEYATGAAAEDERVELAKIICKKVLEK